MLAKIGVAAGGYVAAATLGWLLLQAHQQIGEEIERCNTDKLAAVAEAEQIARDAVQRAAQQRIDMLQRQAAQERKAARIAADAVLAAELEARDAQSEIRRLMVQAPRETGIDPKDCLNVALPASAVDSLRD